MSAVARLSRDFSITGFASFALSPVGPEVSEGKRPAVHIRCFAPAVGVPEDPVTGSANASLPAYLVQHGLLERTGREYIASQGTAIGRDGRVYVRVLDGSGRAEIGGESVTVVEGTISI
jgi:PhzF family phenazine biosynthesis protein